MSLASILIFPYNLIMATRISRAHLEKYLKNRFGRGCRLVNIGELGSGVHGTGFLVEIETSDGPRKFVIKSIAAEGLGHDYPSDRAGMLLMALDNYSRLPSHVQALDVISERPDGTLFSIGGGKEYYLLMEHVEGVSYFNDLDRMKDKQALDDADKLKIDRMAAYLSGLHSEKLESRGLYLRRLRDAIGHGECLMGVFDTYPDGTLGVSEMALIEKLCIDHRSRLKSKYQRLCRVHGDFHPGNIWWRQAPGNPMGEMQLLDRSRGEWGEPADDVTALTVNYVFFSIMNHGDIRGAYLEGLTRFYEEYIRLTNDQEMLEAAPMFYAFRGAVVANPVFYPKLSQAGRAAVFRFVVNVLKAKRFSYRDSVKYLNEPVSDAQ